MATTEQYDYPVFNSHEYHVFRRYENFGSDGGNTVKLMSPKVAFAKNQVETFLSEKLGSNVKFPPIEVIALYSCQRLSIQVARCF